MPLLLRRIIIVLILCIGVPLNAQLLDRQLSLEVHEKSVQYVLKSIETKTGVHIAYSSKLLDAKREVSLSIRNSSIAFALQRLFPLGAVRYKEIGQQLVLYAPNHGTEGGLVAYRGQIKERTSSIPIHNASVYLPELGIGTDTDTNGFFSLTIPDGEYTMIVSSLGYEGKSYSVVLKKGMRLSFQLNKIVTPLDEVIVTTEGVERDRIRPYSPSFLIDMELPQTIYDELKITNLIVDDIRSKDDWVSNFSRGNTPSQNRTFIDQGTVYTTGHLHSFSSAFHEQAVRLENGSGTSSALYGGRLGAVKDFEVYEGHKKRWEGEIQMGSIASSIWFSGPLQRKKTSVSFAARGTYTDLLSNAIASNAVGTSYMEGDVQAKIHHVFKNKDELSFSGFYSQNNFEQENQVREENTGAEFNWKNANGNINWKHLFSKQLELHASLTYTHYAIQFSEMDRNEEQLVERRIKTSSTINDIGVRLQCTYNLNSKHRLKFGLLSTYHQFQPSERFENEVIPLSSETEDELTGIESSAYIEDDWKISEAFTLTPGMRVDHFARKSTQYFGAAPHLGMKWSTANDFLIQAQYTVSNQYTFAVADAGTQLPNDVWIMATDTIRPQQIQKSSLTVSKFLDQYQYQVSGFYKKRKDVAVYRENTSFLVGGANPTVGSWQENVIFGSGWVYGIHCILKKTEGKFKGAVSYQYSKSRQQFADLNFRRKFNHRNDRRHLLTLEGKYQLSKRFAMGFNWVLSSALNYNFFDQTVTTLQDTIQNEVQLTPYHRLDLSVGYQKKLRKRKQHAFELVVYNAYGRKNPIFYELGYGATISRDKEVLKSDYFSFVPSLSYRYSF